MHWKVFLPAQIRSIVRWLRHHEGIDVYNVVDKAHYTVLVGRRTLIQGECLSSRVCSIAVKSSIIRLFFLSPGQRTRRQIFVVFLFASSRWQRQPQPPSASVWCPHIFRYSADILPQILWCPTLPAFDHEALVKTSQQKTMGPANVHRRPDGPKSHCQLAWLIFWTRTISSSSVSAMMPSCTS